jgi:hypothetical protein
MSNSDLLTSISKSVLAFFSWESANWMKKLKFLKLLIIRSPSKLAYYAFIKKQLNFNRRLDSFSPKGKIKNPNLKYYYM